VRIVPRDEATHRLIRAIINAYHTTRLTGDYVPHILSKAEVRRALDEFLNDDSSAR
jgi:hypothetical protein